MGSSARLKKKRFMFSIEQPAYVAQKCNKSSEAQHRLEEKQAPVKKSTWIGLQISPFLQKQNPAGKFGFTYGRRMQLSYTHILVLFVYYHSFINILNYEFVFFYILLLKFIFISVLVFITSSHFSFQLSCQGTISKKNII